MANYGKRLGRSAEAREFFRQALDDFEQAARLAEKALADSQGRSPVELNRLCTATRMRATIYEYQGDGQAARKASELAVEQMDRRAAAQPNEQNQRQQRAMRGRLLRLLSVENASREEVVKWSGLPAPTASQIEAWIAEGWREMAGNMINFGLRVFPSRSRRRESGRNISGPGGAATR